MKEVIRPRCRGEILVRRPNQSHPTFPILLNSNDVPWRTLLALIHDQFLARRAAILDQLEIIGGSPLAQPYSEVTFLLCFTLEPKSTPFGFEGTDLGVDVAI